MQGRISDTLPKDAPMCRAGNMPGSGSLALLGGYAFLVGDVLENMSNSR